MITKIKNINISTWLVILTTIYIAGAVMQNILAVKTFGNELIAITTGGTLISWLVFGCLSMITEVWGKRKATKTFLCGALFNLIFNLICWIAILIPGTNDFVQSSYQTVLGTGWRIVIGSVTAYLLGSFINTRIMAYLKAKSKNDRNKKGFVLRITLATLFGQIVDNALFYLIAFSPIGIPNTIENPWFMIGELVLFTTTIETLVEFMVSPLFAKFTNYLKGRYNE